MTTLTNPIDQRMLLGSLLTQEDQKIEKRERHVNIHRLSLFLEAADRAEAAVLSGATWRDAIRSEFCGMRGMFNRFLKRIGEAPLEAHEFR